MKKYPVLFLDSALDDLGQIWDYLFEQTRDAEIADKKIDEIQSHCFNNLSTYPEKYQLEPEAGKNIRRSVLNPYNIYYQFTGKSVEIIHISRGSRLIENIFS